MTFVAVNVLSVSPGAGEHLESRFAGRAGMVESAPGFVSFELLRPMAGTEQYLVVTHWQTQADYEAWLESRSFAAGHGGERRRPVADGSSIWTFEVVQRADAAGNTISSAPRPAGRGQREHHHLATGPVPPSHRDRG